MAACTPTAISAAVLADGDIGEGGALISRKAALQMKAMAEAWGDVRIRLEGKRLLAEAGGSSLAINLLAGKFPDWTALIPEGEYLSFRHYQEPLAPILRKLKPYASARAKFVFLDIPMPEKPEEGEIVSAELKIENPDIGTAAFVFDLMVEHVPKKKAGIPQGNLSVGVDPSHVENFLKFLSPGDEPEIKYRGEKTPLTAVPAGRDDYVCVISTAAPRGGEF
jgi:DNA polymerase III sliding clamp (beta) subunit (PCNA family)